MNKSQEVCLSIRSLKSLKAQIDRLNLSWKLIDRTKEERIIIIKALLRKLCIYPRQFLGYLTS